jgi:hypothetical protein
MITPSKPRKTYKKRTPKPKPLAIEVKKIIREELLGWNNKFTITYFEEKIETMSGEILKIFAVLSDDGTKLYYDCKPNIEVML